MHYDAFIAFSKITLISSDLETTGFFWWFSVFHWGDHPGCIALSFLP
jgi:hypothetical protein